MSFSFRLALCCLLAFPLSLSASGEKPSPPHAGTIELTLAPGVTSFLPIDTLELKEGLCLSDFTLSDGIGPISPRGECDLSVQVPSGISILYIDTPSLTDKGSWQVPVHFRDLGPWKGSAPVSTSCGLWDVSVGLDPDSEQPVSALVLAASAENPGQGAFAGVVDLAALYRFVSRTGSAHYEVPARLSLDLAGQWATLPPSTPGLADSESNIALFAVGVQGESFSVPACGGWSTTRCAVCMTAQPAQN